MIIRRIHIDSFGPLRDFDCELYSGMNVIRGDNESGKTSLAMFIKFIFYGLSGRSLDGNPSERKKYVNWDTGSAEGYIVAEYEGREYRLERSLSVTVRAGSEKESVSETLTVTDTSTGGRAFDLEESPGAVMFGVPEQVFVNTVFSGQAGRARIDGADTAAAVENMLFSADETVNVKKAAERLDKFRRTLQHKKGGGGEIPALRENCAELKGRLERAGASAAEIIELESAVAINTRAEKETEAEIERQNAALKYYDAVCLCHDGDEAKAAEAEAKAAEAELRSALMLCCERVKLSEARSLAVALESKRAEAAEFESRLDELEVGAANLTDPNAPEDPKALLAEFKRKGSASKGLMIGAVLSLAGAVLAAGGAAVLYAMKSQIFLILLAVAAVFAVICGVFFVLRGRKFSRMKEICRMFDEEDEDGIERAVEFELSRRDEAEKLRRRADSVRMSLEEANERLESLETEANALAASFEDCCEAEAHPEEGADALERLRSAIALAERRQVAAEGAKATWETAEAVARAKWEKIPRDKLAAAAEYIKDEKAEEWYPTSEEDADTIRRELSFNIAKNDALRRKNHGAEVELAAKKAVAESPADLWDEFSSATENLRKMEMSYDAVELAAEMLAEAGENIRRNIIPKIVRRASALFSEATDGRYESLGAGSAFKLSAVMDGHTRDSKLLSAGTEDLVYVCLRVALATELFGDKRPPLIFDESLAFMDQGRSAAAADALAMSGHQVLLFTCRPGEGAEPTLRMGRK